MRLRIRSLSFIMLICAHLFNGMAHAAPLPVEAVPDPLEPWIDWVLQGEESKSCPFIYNNASQHQCAWPTRLELSLDEQSGVFSHVWYVYQTGWLTLPGDQRNWPIDVMDNGTPVSITSRQGQPAVLLEKGIHMISGRFEWKKLPDSLQIPAETGLISLTVKQKEVKFPDIEHGRIWIKKRTTAGNADQQGEQIRMQIYRKLVDENPFQIQTRIDLQVSGKQREALIGRPLLAGDIPLELISTLPARLEADGQLRVQLRPGRWTIDVLSRFTQPVTGLQLSAQSTPWPESEIWVFDARTHLRLVEISGVTSIDPRQTQMPDHWRQLPAYQIASGDSLTFKIIRRGDPEPEPDSLSLQREFWLDQSGDGYTINDRIQGQMTRGWRLEASESLLPGRVTLDGTPQFITQLTDRKGVEVRRGAVNLNADSRYEGNVKSLNAVGWDHDFQNVSAMLHLPPGWKLFTAKGADNVPDTWLQRWTLLDLFLVLIAAVAISHLWNWRIGLLGLATLVLLWHEPGAPRQIWLHIIAAIALLRVLPAGKFRSLVESYRNLALLILILIALPFMINQVRIGLFPQLERPWQSVDLAASRMQEMQTANDMAAQDRAVTEAMSVTEQTMAELPMSEEQAPHGKTAPRSVATPPARAKSDSSYNQSKFPLQYDAKTNVQTGPGLPYWQWQEIPLSWNGPVEKEQMVSLTLISPAMNLVLNLLRILLLMALVLMISGAWQRRKGQHLPFTQGHHAALLLLVPLLGMFAAQDSRAEIPPAEMLEELRTRLLAPADCLPECAHAPRMHLDIRPDQLSIRIEIHTAEDVIVPLPGDSGKWNASQIAINGEPAQGLSRDQQGRLWAFLPKGVHQLILFGALPDQNSIDLALPLRPARTTFETAGWDITGIHDDGIADQQLKLTRLKANQTPESPILEAGTLPPFVQIHRTLRLGLEWRVETRVVRSSPANAAIVIKVPLLEGEALLSDGFQVKDGQVLVSMSANQSSLQWESTLKSADTITLTAPQTPEWTEVWYADISPIWHAESEGIAVVHHQNPDGRWLPEWRPWPGESVTLNIMRPEGIAGQTLTIDTSSLDFVPGQRATDVTLALSIRSSQGSQHTVRLPDQARLQSVTIDGRSQPVRQSGADEREVTLPIHPGKQNIQLSWRQADGIHNLTRTPEVDLGINSVNHLIRVRLAEDRWVLFTGGPQWGPAVLFWGVLIVILLVALGLGRIKLTPLNTWHWILLGIGLSQAPIFSAVLVVAWLLALGLREQLLPKLSKTRFNLLQIGLALLTVIALSALFEAIRQGLLGSPDMQISGNNSTTYLLNWYQDRVSNMLPRAWIISVPLLVYRLLMLAWSLWLAFALLHWLRWGWECYSRGELWRTFSIRKKKDIAPVTGES